MQTDRQGFLDHDVIDEHRQRVGKVTDVIYSDDLQPRWATVKPRPLAGERIVPLSDAYLSETGVLVVPLDRSALKHAPKPPRDHVLSRDDEQRLEEYFHLGRNGG